MLHTPGATFSSSCCSSESCFLADPGGVCLWHCDMKSLIWRCAHTPCKEKTGRASAQLPPWLGWPLLRHGPSVLIVSGGIPLSWDKLKFGPEGFLAFSRIKQFKQTTGCSNTCTVWQKKKKSSLFYLPFILINCIPAIYSSHQTAGFNELRLAFLRSHIGLTFSFISFSGGIKCVFWWLPFLHTVKTFCL